MLGWQCSIPITEFAVSTRLVTSVHTLRHYFLQKYASIGSHVYCLYLLVYIYSFRHLS